MQGYETKEELLRNGNVPFPPSCEMSVVGGMCHGKDAEAREALRQQPVVIGIGLGHGSERENFRNRLVTQMSLRGRNDVTGPG